MGRNWSAQKGYSSLPRKGFGSYRLTILLPRPGMDIGLFVPNQDSAFRLWLDGEMEASNGEVSSVLGSSCAEYRPIMVVHHAEGASVELLLQVSNNHLRHGGWANALFLGSPEGIAEYYWRSLLDNAWPIVCLATLFLYHFVTFLFRRKERSYLYFSLIILSSLVNQGFTRRYLFFTLAPSIPWELGWKAQYACLPLFVLFFGLYLRSLFPAELKRGYVAALVALNGAIAAACLVLPTYIVSLYLTIPLEVLGVLSGLGLAVLVFRAAFRGRENAWLIASGILGLAVLAAWDSLSTSFVLPARWMGNLLGVGFIGFLFLHSIVLSRRFAFAYGRLDRLSEKLEEEVRERTSELARAKEGLEEANRAKTDFFLQLSHEIRTPLTLLVNSVERYAGREDAASRASDPDLLAIRSYLDLLMREILDFFDVTAFEKGLRVYKHDALVDLTALVRGKAELYRSLTEARDMVLSSEAAEGIVVRADPSALDRLLNNLLDNAVKYNRPSGRIRLALTRDLDSARIEVADEGPGIAPEERERVFLPYYRVERSAGRIAGIGLGLALVRGIVDSLGGSIEVSDNLPFGACLVARLPLPSAEDAALPLRDWRPFLTPAGGPRPDAGTAIGEPPEGAPLVLVVEDNEELRKFLLVAVGERYRVIGAPDGRAALEALASGERPGLIVSDVVMRGLDGFGLLAAVKADPGLHDVPFLFLSAMDLDERRREAYEAGVLDWIPKPFRAAELMAKIDSLLRHEAEGREREERRRFASLGILLSAVAHEIFNPLSGISGPLAVLDKRCGELGEPTATEIRRQLDHISRNASRIERIVKTIRDVHAGTPLALEAVELRGVVEEAAAAATGENIAWRDEVPAGLAVLANRFALERIVANAVSNALDAMASGGTLSFSASPNPGSGSLSFSIRDSGSGMSEEACAKAFDPFFSDKGSGHMGMGLYLIRLLCEKMGWNCELLSRPGAGTELRIRAPIAPSPTRPRDA